MFDFITIGGATRDIFLKYDDLKKKKDKNSISGAFLLVPYGEKMVSKDTFYSYGGGAVNSAISIARLGGRVATICNIGIEGTGSLLYKTLQEEGVNTSLIQRDQKAHTGLSVFILGKDNEHSGFLERGANNFLKLNKISLLKKARWLYITSLTGSSKEILSEVFEFAKKNSLKIAFNPGSEQICGGNSELQRYISKTDLLILNMDEAEEVLGQGRSCHKNKRRLFGEVEKLGATITVVTDAENGSHAIFEGKVYSQPAYRTNVVDTTGAGDSFGSTFAFGILSGFEISYSLKIAAINSASVVGQMGAQSGLLGYNQIKRSEWY